MRTLIVTGGTVDTGFAQKYIQQHHFDHMIAADAGIHFFARTGRKPDELLGDFDSACEAELEAFLQDASIRIHPYKPEKDETDTELALRLALERGSSEIHILGATGTRLDHVLGTIHVLGIAMEQGVFCVMADAHNRIRLVNRRLELKKKEQYGRYVSLIPLTTSVTGVTLSGMKYPLSDATLGGCNSLGISNEITGEMAVIEVREGVLIVIESRD